MNGLQMLEAVVDHAGRAFDVDPARIVVQSFATKYGNRKREVHGLLRMPAETEACSTALVYLLFVIVDGKWVMVQSLTGPAK